MANNLMLHCGGYEATEDQVFGVPTPDNTATHFPIPHQSLVQTVLNHVERSGFGVENREYGLMNGGAQMFGLFKLRNGTDQDDYGLVIGLRNCHVKMFTAASAWGPAVSSATTWPSLRRSSSQGSTPGGSCGIWIAWSARLVAGSIRPGSSRMSGSGSTRTRPWQTGTCMTCWCGVWTPR